MTAFRDKWSSNTTLQKRECQQGNKHRQRAISLGTGLQAGTAAQGRALSSWSKRQHDSPKPMHSTNLCLLPKLQQNSPTGTAQDTLTSSTAILWWLSQQSYPSLGHSLHPNQELHRCFCEFLVAPYAKRICFSHFLSYAVKHQADSLKHRHLPIAAGCQAGLLLQQGTIQTPTLHTAQPRTSPFTRRDNMLM